MRAFLSDDFKADQQAIANFELQLLFFLKIGDRQHCRDFVAQLSDTGVPLAGLDAPHAEAIAVLASRMAVVLKSDGGAFAVFAITTDRLTTHDRLPDGQRFRVSRFCYITCEQGVLTIRSPLSDRFIEVYDPAYAAVFAMFAQPHAIGSIVAGFERLADAGALAEMLVHAGMVLPSDENGDTQESRDASQRMWEFHDLLMHSRSRIGRAGGAIGSTYRFPDIPEPTSTPTPPTDTVWTPLSPDIGAGSDITLFDAMARRRSVRTFAPTPLDIASLSLFLHRSVGQLPADVESDGRIRRPYPSGGSLYEQRFYVAVDRVAGLERGLYVYDEVRSRLGLVAQSSAELDTILDNAGRTIGASARPPALIVITSRFGRVSWKYSGLAYALQLKHIGVIQEAMYLTATALGLGGCALGSGETDTFGRLAGLNYLEEGALGEFVLGNIVVE